MPADDGSRRANAALLRRRWPALALAGIVLLALTLRTVHLDFDLPEVYEEATPVRVARSMAGWSDAPAHANPRNFHYPSLGFYLHLAGQVGHHAVGRALGWFAGATPADAFRQDPTGSILTGRLISVLFGVATIWAVFRLGRALGGAGIGLVAAGVLAVLPAHVTMSRMIVVDTPLVFFATLALLESVRIARGGGAVAVARGGLWVGLAASCKYPGALAGVSIAVAIVVAPFARDADDANDADDVEDGEGAGNAGIGDGGAARSARDPAGSPRASWAGLAGRIALAGLAAIGVFLVTSPYVLLDFPRFTHDFGLERRHMAAGHLGLEAGGAAGAYVVALWRSFGPSLLPFLALGAVTRIAALRRDRVWLAPLVYTGLVLGLLSTWSTYREHYLAPILPVMAVLTAVGIADVAGLVARGSASRRARAMAAAAILLIGIAAVGSVGRVVADGRPHTRSGARSWILAHAPEGALIATEHLSADLDDPVTQRRFHVVRIPLSVVDPERSAVFYDPRWYDGFDFVVLGDAIGNRFRDEPARFPLAVAFYRLLERNWSLAEELEGRGGRQRIFVNPIPLDARDAGDIDADVIARLAGTPSGIARRFIAALAAAARSRGWYERAYSLHRGASGLWPDDEPVLVELGMAAVDAGRFEDAVATLDRAIELRPDRAAAHHARGVALYELDRVDEAVAAFRRAVAIDPGHENARYNLETLTGEDGDE